MKKMTKMNKNEKNEHTQQIKNKNNMFYTNNKLTMENQQH